MITINRTAILVKPAQPFLDWLWSVDPETADVTLETLQQEPTIYLLPESSDEEEAAGYLAEVCGQIFEGELDSWISDDSVWPVPRNIEVFDKWFEYQYHSMMVDLCADPLVQEEI